MQRIRQDGDTVHPETADNFQDGERKIEEKGQLNVAGRIMMMVVVMMAHGCLPMPNVFETTVKNCRHVVVVQRIKDKAPIAPGLHQPQLAQVA